VLLFAAQNKRWDTLEMLVRRGANVTLTDKVRLFDAIILSIIYNNLFEYYKDCYKIYLM
jgi:hypothetical protein